jgi:hypothetical protein
MRKHRSDASDACDVRLMRHDQLFTTEHFSIRRLPVASGEWRVLLGYGLTRPSDAQVMTGFELVATRS